MNQCQEPKKRGQGTDDKRQRYNARQSVYWRAGEILEEHEKSLTGETIVNAAILWLTVAAKRDVMQEEGPPDEDCHEDELKQMEKKLRKDVQEALKQKWRDAKRRQREDVDVENVE